MKKSLILPLLLGEALLLALFVLPVIRFAPEEVPLAFLRWECPEGRYDEGWGWSPEEGAPESDAFLTSPSLQLDAGDYLLRVEYEADADQSLRLTDEDNYGLLLPEGEVRLSRSATESAVRVRAAAGIPAMRVRFSYGGEGAFSVLSVRLYTDVAGLTRRAVLLVLLLAALNFLLFAPRLRLPAAAALAIALCCSLPLFMDKIADGHDCAFHLMRIEALADGLSRGVFPLRLSALHLDGWGYPASVYYGDLLLYLPAALRLLGFSVTGAYKAYVFFLNLLTAAAGIACFSRISGDPKRGALLSLVYCTAGYRMTDLYVRMAVGEYTAMLFFLPVAAGLWDLLAETPRGRRLAKDALLLAAGFAGLVTCHLLSTELALAACVVVCLCLPHRALRPRTLGAVALGAAAALLLAAFFAVPLLDYLRNVPVSITSVPNPNAQRIRVEGAHVAQLFSLFQSPFGGEGLNTPAGRFALTPGPAVFALPAALALLLAHRGNRRLAALSGFSFLFLWLSTDCFPWDRLEETPLGFLCGIQFPWRVLAVASLLLCLLLMELLSHPDCPKEAPRLIAVLAVLCCCVFTGQYAQEGHFIEPFDRAEIILSPDEVGGGEYMRYSPETDRVADDGREALTRDIPVRNVDWMQLLSREGNTFVLDVMGSPEADGEIRLPLFRYKGIEARDGEGNLLPVSDGENCRVTVGVPAGFDGRITVAFREPAPWRAASLVSLAALLAALLSLVLLRERR